MKIRCEERNGRRYAYVCTSKRVPGKDKPVSIKKYLGVVDPNTGKISCREDLGMVFKSFAEGYCESRNLGIPLAMKMVSDRLGITAGLERTFGDGYRTILALASALLTDATGYDPVDLIGSIDLEPFGFSAKECTRKDVESALALIDEQTVSEFTKSLIRNGSRIVAYVERPAMYASVPLHLGGLHAPDYLESTTSKLIMDEHGVILSHQFQRITSFWANSITVVKELNKLCDLIVVVNNHNVNPRLTSALVNTGIKTIVFVNQYNADGSVEDMVDRTLRINRKSFRTKDHIEYLTIPAPMFISDNDVFTFENKPGSVELKAHILRDIRYKGAFRQLRHEIDRSIDKILEDGRANPDLITSNSILGNALGWNDTGAYTKTKNTAAKLTRHLEMLTIASYGCAEDELIESIESCIRVSSDLSLVHLNRINLLDIYDDRKMFISFLTASLISALHRICDENSMEYNRVLHDLYRYRTISDGLTVMRTHRTDTIDRLFEILK